MTKCQTHDANYTGDAECRPCSTCAAPSYYEDMGFFFHCDDASSSQSWCTRAQSPDMPPRQRWWKWL